jgi:dienelactone hydrolase
VLAARECSGAFARAVQLKVLTGRHVIKIRWRVVHLIAMLTLLACMSVARGQPAFDDATVGGPGSGMAGEFFPPTGQGPFPAVVILHGCDGVGPHYRQWPRRLRAWGYAALIVDSFKSRGVLEVCGEGKKVDPVARAQDALRAAAWLRTRSDILPDKIGVIGFSHGGWSVLKAVLDDAVAASDQPGFAAAVAYYPGCETPRAKLATDTLILIGAADDWTPAWRCQRWVQEADRAGHTLEIEVYPGALHGFDTTAPLHVYAGHQVGGNPTASAAAEAEARAFLDARLGRN